MAATQVHGPAPWIEIVLNVVGIDFLPNLGFLLGVQADGKTFAHFLRRKIAATTRVQTRLYSIVH